MKTGSRSLFILSIIWIVVSLLWLFRAKNIPLGVISLCSGIAELIIAIITKKKERK